jgi:hypothetical protein
VLEDEYRSEPSSEDESDCCEAGFMESIGVAVDGSLEWSTMTRNLAN